MYGYMHTNYTATFFFFLVCYSGRLVTPGWRPAVFLGHGPGCQNTPPPTRPPTQGHASDIHVAWNNASGVERGLGPDAAGEKLLQRGIFFSAANLTCKNASEHATKPAAYGNHTWKAAAEPAALKNGSELRSAVGRALRSQLTCPPLLIKTKCDDFRILQANSKRVQTFIQ